MFIYYFHGPKITIGKTIYLLHTLNLVLQLTFIYIFCILQKEVGSWASSVLGWFSALLRYNILDTDNILLRLCYLPCFNLLANFKLVSILFV